MSSKYDKFWEKISDKIIDAIRRSIQNNGSEEEIDISDIRNYGDRNGWYAKGQVPGKKDEMAHGRSFQNFCKDKLKLKDINLEYKIKAIGNFIVLKVLNSRKVSLPKPKVRNLAKELNNILSNLRWKSKYLGKGYGTVDISAECEGKIILIEVEIRRSDPVNNIVKIWRWFVNRLRNNNNIFIYVIHAFYKNYYTGKKARKFNATFIGKYFSETNSSKIKYFWFDFENTDEFISNIKRIIY
ncbi:MAG: DUF7664 domain-containing protein [Promethearchaeota archaeon]